MNRNWISVDAWIRPVFPDPVTYHNSYYIYVYSLLHPSTACINTATSRPLSHIQAAKKQGTFA